MNLSRLAYTDLASCLEHREPGNGQPICHHSPDLAALAELAWQLRRLPPAEPDPSWLGASKRRLLARFDAIPTPAC